MSSASEATELILTNADLDKFFIAFANIELTLIFIFAGIVLLIGLVFGLCITRKWHA